MPLTAGSAEVIFFAPRCDVDPPPLRRVDVLRAAAGGFLGGAVFFGAFLGADGFLAAVLPAAFFAVLAFLAGAAFFAVLGFLAGAASFAVLAFLLAVAERAEVDLVVAFDAAARFAGAFLAGAFFMALAVDFAVPDRLVLFPAAFFAVALVPVDLLAFAGFFAAAFFAVVVFAAAFVAGFAIDRVADLVALLVVDLRAEDALRDTEADFVAPAVRAAWVPRAAEVK